MSDVGRGVFRKYDVKRTDGSGDAGGKHEGCAYFVMDLEHDPFALPAMEAYAKACAKTHPALAEDLRRIISTSPCGCRGVGDCMHFLSPQTPNEALADAMERGERRRPPENRP